MNRQFALTAICAVGVFLGLGLSGASAQQPCGPGCQPGGGGYPAPYGVSSFQQSPYSMRDCNRFYHYPYVYYPQNFWGNEYYRSADSLYYRYPPEMRIPVYNRQWHNELPQPRRYHWGHHFMTDYF